MSPAQVPSAGTIEASAARKEAAWLRRLHRQLEEASLKDAKAYEATIAGLKGEARGLQQTLDVTRRRCKKLEGQVSTLRSEAAERRRQLDDALSAQQLYDAGAVPMRARQQGWSGSLPALAPAPTPATPHDTQRQQTIVHSLRSKAQRLEVRVAEQDREIEQLTSLVEKRSANGDHPPQMHPPMEDDAAVQRLNAQLGAARRELKAVQQELNDERTARHADHSLPLMSAGVQTDREDEEKEAEAGGAARLSSLVARLIEDKEQLQRQLEEVGHRLMGSRDEEKKRLEQLVSVQFKVNGLKRERAVLAEEVERLQAAPPPLPLPAPPLPPPQVRDEATQYTPQHTLQQDSSAQTEAAAPEAEAADAAADSLAALLELSEERDVLQVQLDEATVALKAAEKERDTQKAAAAEMHERCRALQVQVAHQADEARVALEGRERDEQNREELQAQLHATAAEKEVAARDALQAADDLKQVLRENAVLSQQLSQAVAARDVAGQDSNSRAAAAVDLEHQLHAARTEYSELLLVYQKLCREHDTLREKLAGSEKETQAALEAVRLEKQRCDAAAVEAAATAQREQETAVDLQTANFEVAELNRRVLQGETEKRAVQRELEECLRELRGREKLLQAADRGAREAERERALQHNEVAHLMALLEERSTEVSSLTRALAAEQDENRRISQTLGDERKRHAAALTAAESQTRAVHDWESRAATLDAHVVDVQHEATQLRTRCRQLETRNKDLEAATAKAEVQAQRAEEHNRRLKDTNMNLIRQYEAAQSLIQVQDEELRRVKSGRDG